LIHFYKRENLLHKFIIEEFQVYKNRTL